MFTCVFPLVDIQLLVFKYHFPADFLTYKPCYKMILNHLLNDVYCALVIYFDVLIEIICNISGRWVCTHYHVCHAFLFVLWIFFMPTSSFNLKFCACLNPLNVTIFFFKKDLGFFSRFFFCIKIYVKCDFMLSNSADMNIS